MNTKNNIKILWEYLSTMFEMEQIEAAFDETIEEFEFDSENFKPSAIDKLSIKEARTLLFDIGYMAQNGLFGGDCDTWDDVLRYTLGFDEKTIEILNS